MADTTPGTVAVPVDSAWTSKINWTQAVQILSTVMTLLLGPKFAIPTDTQLAIVAAINSIAGVATWIMRTWFTKSVTPASVANATTAQTLTTRVVHIT